MFQDKTLVCRDCGNEFIFSASEQEFFAEKGFTNEPGRCAQCRAERKQRNSGSRFSPGLHGKCMTPSVPIAALQLRCRSNPAVTVQSIAVTATPNEEIVIKAE